jgi:hypothetical protein
MVAWPKVTQISIYLQPYLDQTKIITRLTRKKLQRNLNAATDVYINSVSGSPCVGNPIKLYKGARNPLSKNYYSQRENLITFLQDTKKKKHCAIILDR